ncbi:MAG TPA: aminotransferase class III-fold pyridoxal phosphate-dependent enzyme [Myxococcota bacterium]|nr:aminotransferase class III-fold pyridoxal phosphate-dependent enzyme [Myxococcota bacterium]
MIVSPSIPGEPASIQVRTAIPGPASQALRASQARWMDARSIHFYTDAQRSLGNYIVDADGNVLLDLYGHIAALPLGYNHPDLIAAWEYGRFRWTAGFRPALGVSPPVDYVRCLERSLAHIAPAGMEGILTVTTGAEALENAFKIAFLEVMRRKRGGPPTAEDQAASMLNAQTEANALKILSFEGAFHGRSLGALSATRSKAIHKVDFPAFEWPVAPFPANLFPLEVHAEENARREAESLAAVEHLLREAAGTIAGIVVEPIQGEGGDRHASPAFFRALQRLAKQYGALLIVDEVQTGGGGTGLWWEHTRWELPEPPDVVTFSKKMQVGGCYFRKELMPDMPYRIFNTFLGDPLRLAQLEVIIEVVERDRLLENVQHTGATLLGRLKELEAAFPGLISQPRGQGTWCAFDLPDAARRDAAVERLRQRGVEMGGCGSRSIRFRPALILQPRHVDEAMVHLRATCAELR